MARVRFNNTLANSDYIIGGKVAENMIMGGKVVWPVEAAYGASDGSAFRAFMRALVSQYDDSLYVDFAGQTNASGAVTTPNVWGFGCPAGTAYVGGSLGTVLELEGSAAASALGIPSSSLSTETYTVPI